jgi:serine/threonine protein phosphatase PrpC
MMDFIVAMHTDKGIKKNTNQDSLFVKVANTSQGKVAFSVVCDGMGGLSKGELASATVLTAFSNWFTGSFSHILNSDFSDEDIKTQWHNLVIRESNRIMEYGQRNGVSLGTTATVLLIAKGRYYIMNIGDSRAYEIGDRVSQITKDQTFVAREIERGNMTPEQAKSDPRRNVLLQCVGASKVIEPDFFVGEAKKNVVYMLCSDGFRHEITESEILRYLNKDVLLDETSMKDNACYLVELNKQRMELDNISVTLIRTF